MKKINQNKIGVLGGIGPEATQHFYLKLIQKLQNNKLIKSNTDYPQIIINSIPAPELTSHGKIELNKLAIYTKGLKELAMLQPDFIVMICNTIHSFINDLQAEINTPIIDLRKEVQQLLLSSKVKKLTILGTPSTINEGLYKFDGFTYLDLEEKDLLILSKTIEKFNAGIKRDKQISTVELIAKKYISKGADKILVGCTEFSLMLKNKDLPTLDTLDVLVDLTYSKINKQ